MKMRETSGLAKFFREASGAGRMRMRKSRTTKVRRPPMCEGCGVNRSDPPSKLCVGCQAYQEHQR